MLKTELPQNRKYLQIRKPQLDLLLPMGEGRPREVAVESRRGRLRSQRNLVAEARLGWEVIAFLRRLEQISSAVVGLI